MVCPINDHFTLAGLACVSTLSAQLTCPKDVPYPRAHHHGWLRDTTVRLMGCSPTDEIVPD